MKSTLYWRLALAFLVLVVLQSISLLFIWHYTSQQYSNEIIQRLNEDIPYIFERYYRCQQQQHSSKLGTGLGLAIVKKNMRFA